MCELNIKLNINDKEIRKVVSLSINYDKGLTGSEILSVYTFRIRFIAPK